tara:strand:- start:112 stop:975 length:864 start_codon:yes stop_codon:yes gene_type:complete
LTKFLPPLPDLLIEPIVRAALMEDLGRAGDITTAAVVPEDTTVTAAFVARTKGTIAGLDVARMVFRLMDAAIDCRKEVADGTDVEAGQVLMRVAGRAQPILSAERVSLNLLGRLSGIATATAALVAAVGSHPAGITCTRKTTPGLRALEKFAVRAGGGVNHRFGLDDAVLIKDNHVALAGGVGVAVRSARARVGHLVKVEVEIDSLDQLDEALAAGPDAILLDNMTPDELREAVRRVDGRATSEASGGITLASVPAIAATGVDLISAGWLTHSAPSLDIGLDIDVSG